MRKHLHAIFAGIIVSLAAASASAAPWGSTITKYAQNHSQYCKRLYINGDIYDLPPHMNYSKKIQVLGSPNSWYRYDQFKNRCGNGRPVGGGWVVLGYPGEWNW